MMQIRPITDLRNTTEISEICHANDEPIYITRNGYGDLVVMSIEAYEKKCALADLYSKLAVGEKQIEDGLVVSAEEAFAKLWSKYGKKV